MNRKSAANLYSKALVELSGLRDDLSEIKKAEMEAKVNGYRDSSGSTSDRRHSADLASLDSRLESINRETSISNIEDQLKFYTLIIQYDLEVD